MQDGGSGSADAARVGCEEPRNWVRKQPGFSQSHGGDTALQSVSIVRNWHFLMEKKKVLSLEAVLY